MDDPQTETAQAVERLKCLSEDALQLASAWLGRLGSGHGAEGGPLGRALAVEFLTFDHGVCRAALEVDTELWNPLGVAHGAVAYALIDYTMGGAVASLVGAERGPATIEIKVSYLRPFKAGRLVAESRVIREGKHVVFLESEVRDTQGELIATGTGSFYVS